MIRLSSLSWLVLIVGCAVMPTKQTIAPTSTAAYVATATPTIIATPTLTRLATNAPVTRIIVQQNTLLPIVATPPTIAVPPTLARQNWRTFIHPTLQLAIDYPLNWDVSLAGNTATFHSPEDIVITLMPGGSGELALPNTRCTNRANSYGVAVRICLATIGFSSNAYLTFKTADQPVNFATLTTQDRRAISIFDALCESARPVK